MLATQNPLEMEGTYPLPEAQLDRFLYKIHRPHAEPGRAGASIIELSAAPRHGAAGARHERQGDRPGSIRSCATSCSPEIRELIARLVLATHPERKDAPDSVRRFVRHGASPRAALAIAMASRRARSWTAAPTPSATDIPPLFKPALRHRIGLNFEGEAEGVTTDQILDDVLAR